MRYFLTTIISVLLIGCSGGAVEKRPVIAVSIAPLEWIAGNLVDSTLAVAVVVPAGSSPETYEPTVRQIEQLSSASAYFSIGLLDFEHALQQRITDLGGNTKFVELSADMDIMAGDCGHNYSDHSGEHTHGVDPHIWLSPTMVKSMIAKVADAICLLNINPRDAVMRKADSLTRLVDSLDSYIKASLAGKEHIFAIVHPSLSYFARDYGLTQKAIEVEGKEPSALIIKQLVDTLKKHNIHKIFYGIQNSDASAAVIAAEIGATLVPYDPLQGDWLSGMYKITNELCN